LCRFSVAQQHVRHRAVACAGGADSAAGKSAGAVPEAAELRARHTGAGDRHDAVVAIGAAARDRRGVRAGPRAGGARPPRQLVPLDPLPARGRRLPAQERPAVDAAAPRAGAAPQPGRRRGRTGRGRRRRHQGHPDGASEGQDPPGQAGRAAAGATNC